MRIGIDSYSYHRLLGGARPGEEPVSSRWETREVLAHAAVLGVDGVSIETHFLRPGDERLLAEREPTLELALAWGHPHGLEYGANSAALAELLAWLDRASALGCETVRCVAASPALPRESARDVQLAATVAPLAAAARRAEFLGLRLALENHGDLTAAELRGLLERVDSRALGVCFDSANALRVGDDPVEAAALLSRWVTIIHLKDVEPLANVSDAVAGPCSRHYGDGVIAVEAVLDVLIAAGFEGLACVEIAQLAPGADEVALVEAGVAWLQSFASSKG